MALFCGLCWPVIKEQHFNISRIGLHFILVKTKIFQIDQKIEDLVLLCIPWLYLSIGIQLHIIYVFVKNCYLIEMN